MLNERGAGGVGWEAIDDWINGEWRDADIDATIPSAGRIVFTFHPTGDKEFKNIGHPRFALPDWSELRIKSRIALTEGGLRLDRVWIADVNGEIALVEGEVPLSAQDPPTDLLSFLRSLEREPWRIALRLAPRRLDTLPRPLLKHMPVGVLASASLTAIGGDGQPARVDASGTMEWVEAALDVPCARDLRPALQIRGATRDGTTTIELTGIAEYDPGAAVRIEAAPPIDEWIHTGVPTLPEPDVLLTVSDVPLEM